MRMRLWDQCTPPSRLNLNLVCCVGSEINCSLQAHTCTNVQCKLWFQIQVKSSHQLSVQSASEVRIPGSWMPDEKGGNCAMADVGPWVRLVVDTVDREVLSEGQRRRNMGKHGQMSDSSPPCHHDLTTHSLRIHPLDFWD